VFKKKIILFVKNDKSVEMSNIGVVKYGFVGSIDLNDLKHIDIKYIVNGGKRVLVYPHDDQTLCLLTVNSTDNILTRIIMDSDKNIILPSKTFTTNSTYKIYQFKKYKNNIFVKYYNSNSYNGGYSLSKFNLDLSVVNTVNFGYNTTFLSANDAHVYAYYKNQFSLFSLKSNWLISQQRLKKPLISG